MSETEQATNGAKKWIAIVAAVVGTGAVGGSGWLGNVLGGKAVEEAKKEIVAVRAHCDTERGKVVSEMNEARKAFADLTKTLQLTIGKMEGLEKAQDVVAKRFDEHLRDFFQVISGRTK